MTWQRAHALVLETFRSTDGSHHPRVRPVFDQLRRAALSVEANLVEGYALGTPLLFRRHVRIALGSAAEAECLVNVSAELGYLSADVVARLRALVDPLQGNLFGLLRSGIRTKVDPRT